MADTSQEESFRCSVCLDLLKDPVTIPCGHSYCLDCIEDHWSHERPLGVYSCPQCRQNFMAKPELRKNIILAEVVEKLRFPEGQTTASLPDCSYAGPQDVKCGVCTGRKFKAVKSCLECLVSYCDIHLRHHEELFLRKRHTLVEASASLREMICPHHHKLVEVFCRTDQQGVCYQCMLGEHRGHDTVSAAEERQRQQRQVQRKIKREIQMRVEKLPEAKKRLETLRSSAQTAVEDSERIFTEMIRSIERRRSEVTELIRAQEKAEVSQAEGLLKRLEQEIAELKWRGAQLEHLSNTQDHIHFLQNFQSLDINHESTDLSISNANGNPFEKIQSAVSHLRNLINDMSLEGGVTCIERADPEALCSVPKTREDFLRYSCKLTLDPNTAFKHIQLSEENKMVSLSIIIQTYPDHPERFTGWCQVLCKEPLCGCCYWEVEWTGRVAIAVAYKSINRKGGGNGSGFGYNNQSWCLDVFKYHCIFRHDNKEVHLPVVQNSRIGVYVDYKAGILAFYKISTKMTLLHRVHTTFTQPLYPGFSCRFQVIDWKGSTVKILE